MKDSKILSKKIISAISVAIMAFMLMPTFSISQMSKDKFTCICHGEKSCVERTFSISQMSKDKFTCICHGEKSCVERTFAVAQKEQAMETIRQKNESYKTVVSSFTQVKSMKGVKKEIVNEGTLYFARNTDQLIMQYTKPKGNQLLITADKLIVINGASRNVFNTKTDATMKAMKWTLIYCIGGQIEKAAQAVGATITLKPSDKYYIFELSVGKQAKGGWSALEVSYSKTDMSLCQMKMVEKNGNTTTYNTPDKEFNTPLPEGIFNN